MTCKQAPDLVLSHRPLAVEPQQLIEHPGELGLGFEHVGLAALADGVARLGYLQELSEHGPAFLGEPPRFHGKREVIVGRS